MNLRYRLASQFFLLALFPIALQASPLRLQVFFQGLNPTEAALVASNLSLKAAEKETDLSLDRIESLQQIAPREITRSLETLGYYQPKISARIQATPHTYQIIYLIEKGPPILIQSITLQVLGEGQESPQLLQQLQNSPFKLGTPFKHAAYENYKQNLLSTALQQGYLEAKFIQSEVRIHQGQRQATIILILETGKRYKMGPLLFKNPPYPANYLRRYLKEVEGRPYTTQTLLECQKILTETELFSKVRLDPQFEAVEEDAIPLQFRLTPRPKNKYTGSLGYGSDTGPRGSLGWQRRRQHHPGHLISTEFKASQRMKQVNLQYSLPGENPRFDRYIFGLQGNEEKLWDGKYSRRAEFGVTHLKHFNQWERRLQLKNLSEVYRELPSDPKRDSHFLMPELSLAWRSHPNPHQDIAIPYLKIGLTTRGGLGVVFSSTNFIQAELRLNALYPFNDKTRLIARGEVGTTGAKNFDDVPYSLRYFTGGDHSVRGYGYKSLGPIETDKSGREIVVGGRYLIVGSLELERVVYKRFSLATFMDAGQAMNRWNTRLALGAGGGARYATPLGPLRLDVAQPFHANKHRIRVHITFGLDL